MSRGHVAGYPRRRMGMALAVLITLILCSVASAAQIPEIMPVTAVTKGQFGIGKTVISGTEVEEFAVEVLGIVEGEGPLQALVLVRTFGPLIERTGGIAAGMSGSPVFIDGRLLGALAFGFSMADHTIGLVTPAEDMRLVHDLLAISEGEENTVPNAVVGDGCLTGVVLAKSRSEAEAVRGLLPAEVAVAVPLATPLAVSGLGHRTRALLESLGSALSTWDMLKVPGGKAPVGVDISGFEPGSAFGIQLIQGDISMTALGTVTFVGEQGFVGFGHPLLNKGEVDYFVTGAYVHEVVRSVEMPFKIGAPLKPIGRLRQDRYAGVAGLIGQVPESVSVNVDVHDASLKRTTRLSAEIVHDENLTVPLLAITLLEAFDRAIDRIGTGTADMTATIEAEGLSKAIVRDNVFFSATDISAASLGELLLGVQRLVGNEFAEVKLQSIEIKANVETARRTARIESARPDRAEVVAGEEVEVEVTLRPYRQETATRRVTLSIPPETAPGEVTVMVRSGGFGAPRVAPAEIASKLQETGEETDEDEVEEVGVAASLELFIADLFARDRNCDIVAEFYPLPSEEELEGQLTYEIAEWQEDMPELWEGNYLFGDMGLEPVKARLETSFYVQGATSFPLHILPIAGNDEAAEDPIDDNG